MKLLTAIIIAKNAENIIADAISSVSFADEVIVVDNGSSDRTIEIAKYMKSQIVRSDAKNFSELRIKGMENAKSKWVFYLDADERVTKELERDILDVIQNKSSFVAYKVHRKNFYLGENEWPHIESLERLFQKEKLKSWHGILHETPIVNGKIGQLSGYLMHFTHQDLATMLKKTIIWSEHEAGLRFAAHHPAMKWWRFPRVMISAFFDSYIKQKGWKAGTVGLVESIYQSFSMFITYARLWEMQLNKKNFH